VPLPLSRFFSWTSEYGICFQWPANERWAEQWHSRYGFDVKSNLKTL